MEQWNVYNEKYNGVSSINLITHLFPGSVVAQKYLLLALTFNLHKYFFLNQSNLHYSLGLMKLLGVFFIEKNTNIVK